MTETRRRPLSRQRILAAAIRLVDRDGLAALSMRRLGRELGVEGMALYKHVPSKAALLDGMVGAVLKEMTIPAADPARWEDDLRAVAHAYRRLGHAHPHVFPLVATRPLNAPEVLRPLETALAILRGAGFDRATALHAFRAIPSYVEGFVLGEIAAAAMTGDAELGPPFDFGAVPPERFPLIAEAAAYFAGGRDADAEFAFGLDLIVVGLRAKLPGAERQGFDADRPASPQVGDHAAGAS